jgi:predicted HicB family RNase H-like nuclease
MMEHKGYTGKITAVDEKQGLLHGEVVGINDVVTFQGKSVAELAEAFRDSVEDYLAFCEEQNEAPEKPYSGKFLLRIPADLHRRASLAAKQARESLNSWVASAIKARLNEGPTAGQELRGAPPEDLLEAARAIALLAQVEGRPSVHLARAQARQVLREELLAQLEARFSDPLARATEFQAWPSFLPPSSELDPLRSEVYRLLLERLQRHRSGGKGTTRAPTSRVPREPVSETEETE